MLPLQPLQPSGLLVELRAQVREGAGRLSGAEVVDRGLAQKPGTGDSAVARLCLETPGQLPVDGGANARHGGTVRVGGD